MSNEFSTIRKTSTSIQVVETIKDALINGRLKIGDKLPPERELAQQLGVGRSTLREAISMLSTYGIVERRQGEGTFIIDRFAENVLDFLGFSVIANKQNYKHLMSMRRVLEGGCVNMIVENFNEDDYKEMLAMVNKLEVATEMNEKIKFDAQFHEKLINITRNPLIIQIYKMMSKLLVSLIEELMARPGVQEIAHKDHKEILEYLSKRNVAECRKSIEEHLGHIEKLAEEKILKVD